MNNQNAFSLLELIIVIIIVGVLSAIALPRYINMIEFSRSSEAVVNIKFVRDSVERCYMASYNYNKCNLNNPDQVFFPNKLDIEDPGLLPNAHFSYKGESSLIIYWVEATRNALDGASYAGEKITYVYKTDASSSGPVYLSRHGTGPYEALEHQ